MQYLNKIFELLIKWVLSMLYPADFTLILSPQLTISVRKLPGF